MKTKCLRTVLGIYIPKRAPTAIKVQKCLSKYGTSIRTRLGLHHGDLFGNEDGGLIVLELVPNATREAEKSLRALRGVVVKKMIFECAVSS